MLACEDEERRPGERLQDGLSANAVKKGGEPVRDRLPGGYCTNGIARSLLVEDDRSEFAEAATPGQPLVGGSLGNEERGLDAEFIEGIRDALCVFGSFLGAEADEDVVDVLGGIFLRGLERAVERLVDRAVHGKAVGDGL